MVNFTALAATAKRLIEANGRSVTLVQHSTTPADSAQPWRGPDESARTETAVTGVFLSGTSDSELGEMLMLIDAGLIQRGEKFFLVAADSLGSVDIKAQASLVDDNQLWQVSEIATLQPGPTPILHALVLKK